MTGYPNSNTTESQPAQPQAGTYTNTGTGAAPTQSSTAAQGGLLGMAQGWTSRVTTNLQGQTEQLKGKLGLQGTAGQGTATGQNTTGTRTGYEPIGTGTRYGSTTGTGSGYNPTGTGAGYSQYNTAGNQAGVPHGHNPTLNQGYAPGQTGPGVGTADPGVSATGTAAPKPSYTDQAKDWTARVADNLHGQAEYLKTKVTGAPGTTTGTGTGTGYSQGAHPGQQAGQFGQGQGQFTQGQGQFGQGTAAGGSTGFGQDPAYRSSQPGVNPAAGSQEGKKSWTDSAKSWTATGLTYTQKGLEGIKNSVAGPSGTTTGSTATGTAGSNYNTGSAASGTTGGSYATGQPATGANIDPNRKY